MIKYAHVYAFFLVFVFHTSCGQNQTNVPQVNIYSEPKDLVTPYGPRIMVRNIKQQRNGNILIAGSNSSVFGDVYRYDGKSFTNLTSKISSHRFWDILEDRRGNIWFASLDSGVYYYNGKTFQHFTTRNGLANNMVMSIYEDKAGNIWFGASRYDGKSFRNFTTENGMPDDGVKAMMEDHTGKLWFATPGGPCFYDGKTFTVLKDRDGKTFKNVWSIIEDKKDNIWFGVMGGREGLWRYNGSTFARVSQRPVYAVIEDKKGNIWTTGPVSGQGWALSRYDKKSLYNKLPSATDIFSRQEPFFGILEANDGSIWFGASDGVYRYDGKTITDFKSANKSFNATETGRN